MRQLVDLFIMAAALMLSLHATATEFTIVEEIDARNFAPSNLVHGTHSPFSLAKGDKLTLYFTFLPGQVLQLVNPTLIIADLTFHDPTIVSTTTQESVGFSNLMGPAHNSAQQTGSTSGGGMAAAFLDSAFMDAPLPGTISFETIVFRIEVISFSDGSTSKLIDYTRIGFGADSLSVSSVFPPPVSEPPALALLLIGLLIQIMRAKYRQKNSMARGRIQTGCAG